MEKNKKIFSYTNRKGDVYYFRKTDTGRGGEQIVASKKCPDDALTAILRRMGITETPNGKVSCRKKQKNKACGWMLREVGKRDRSTLTAFLNDHRLAMPRTMLRYAIEHYPAPLRCERSSWQNEGMLRDIACFQQRLRLQYLDKTGKQADLFSAR